MGCLPNIEMNHFVVSSLNSQESPIVERLVNNARVVVSDVDYTLFDFEKGHLNGQKVLEQIFDRYFSYKVDYLFRLTLDGQRKPLTEAWENRNAYTMLVNKIKALQSSFIDTYGVKVFSREAEIAIAAELVHRPIKKALIEQGRDAYWSAVGNVEAIYPDAQVFIDELREKSIPLILMSGSDCIMQVNEDCTFDYDPDMSSAYKQKRFEKLQFPFVATVFGDPIDKPDTRFFETVFESVEKNLGYMVPKERILFVGDSLRNDLEVPHDREYKTLLIKRD